MRPFVYLRPASVEEALKSGSSHPDSEFLAGGTTLLDLMKLAIQSPQVVIDIARVPGLNGIEERDDSLQVGALVSNADLAKHRLVRERLAVVAQALESGASPQLRNMATVAGNILQRTRCTYYRDVASACNKRSPGSGCDALGGYNRGHAILGVSEHCIAVHPSDLAVALAVLDPVISVRGPQAARDIPYRDLHVVPGATPQLESTLRKGELITGLRIPFPPSGARSGYLKIRDRASYEFALASAAVVISLRDGRIDEARLAIGGVATKPWRATAAEESLRGAVPNADAFARAATLAVAGAQPRPHNAFKIALIQRTIVRQLEGLTIG